MYSEVILMSGLTAFAPAMKPASKRSIRPPTPLTPPMKPSWPVLLFSAAAAPTRNEPCCSEKTRPAMFGPYGAGLAPEKSSMPESITPKVLSGLALPTAAASASKRNPTATTMSLEAAARSSSSLRFEPSSLGDASV